MVQDAEVKVVLRAEGAEETKQRLLDTRAALIGVSSGQLEHAQSMRTAARDATALNNAEAYQSRIFLAQHPALNTLTRGLRDLGTVSRGVLAITTAFSTAISAFNSTASGIGETQAELDQARREQAFALKTYGFNSKEYADATDKVHEFESKMKDLNAQASQENITRWLNVGAAIGILSSSLIKVIPAIVAALPSLTSLSFAFAGMSVSLGPILLIAAAIAAVAFAVSLLIGKVTGKNPLAEFFRNILPDQAKFLDDLQDRWSKGVDNIIGFAKHMATEIRFAFSGFADWVTTALAPTLVKGFVGVWNGIVQITNSGVGDLLKGIETLANGFISVINALISGYNRVAGFLHLPQAGFIGSVSIPFTPIPTIAAANGFNGDVTSPTMFLAGEAGTEHVNITPSSGGGGGGGTTIIVNVAGTVRSDQDLAKFIDSAMKNTLKRHGWT